MFDIFFNNILFLANLQEITIALTITMTEIEKITSTVVTTEEAAVTISMIVIQEIPETLDRTIGTVVVVITNTIINVKLRIFRNENNKKILLRTTKENEFLFCDSLNVTISAETCFFR